MDKLLSIGKILNFHGIKGEVKVGYTAGSEKFLTDIEEMYIVKDSKTIKLTPQKIRFHKNQALIKFEEINSIDEVLEYKGLFLKTNKEYIKDFLNEDEFYIDDLVGLKVYNTDGDFVGTVSNIATIKNTDMLLIKDQANKEHMVPFKKELVPEVRIKEEKVIIENIEGLIEKNEV